MEITTLSTKGQIVLPKAIREARQWRAGTEFVVEETAAGVTLRPLKSSETTLDEVMGYLKYKGPAKTLRQMDQAIGKVIKERHARGRY